LYRVRPAEAGDAEEGRKRFCITECGVDRSDAAIHLTLGLLFAETLETVWMILAVRTDRVSGVVDTPHNGRVGACHFADQEIRGFHALRGEGIENGVGVGWDGPVIEGDDDLMIVERQRLRVLHAADTGEFGWADCQRSAGAKRIRITGAGLRGGRGYASGKTKKQNKHDTHKAPRPRADRLQREAPKTIDRDINGGLLLVNAFPSYSSDFSGHAVNKRHAAPRS